jgi:hypothetical protein
MEVIKRGELLVPGRTQWPETIEYNYTLNGHEIRIFMRSPIKEEIQSIRQGLLDFALYNADLPVVLIKTEAIPWSDCPFSYWLVPPDYRQIPPEIKAGEMAIINIILVDADTGIVKGIRSTSLSTEFSQKLHESIQKQIDEGEFSPSEFAKRGAKIQRYSAEELSKMATDRFTSGKSEGKKKGFG